MRNLFFALVLANLAVAAWHSWFPPLPRPTLTLDPEAPSIELVSEVSEVSEAGAAVNVDDGSETGDAGAGGDGEAPAEATVAALPASDESPPPADVAAERCVSIGPFRDLGQTVDAGAKLRAGGYDPVQRVGEGDIWVGYWVYIDGIATRDAANQAVADLRVYGVADAYAIPAESGGNIVSLGVFSELQRATARLEQAQRWGFEPTITDRSRRGTVYWVEIVLPANQSLDLNLLRVPGQIIRLEQRACEAADG